MLADDKDLYTILVVFCFLTARADMRTIHDIMRKTLSQKFLGKQAIGAIAQNVIHKLFPSYAKDMLVYIKTDIVFIKPANHRDKVALYKEQDRIIQSVNAALEKIGYPQKIQKVFFK